MARRAEAVGRRFHRLKLKLGGADGLDVERVRAVRSVTDLPLQVDVNEYWSLEEALENVKELARLNVDYVEQPLRAGDPGGAQLKEASPLPIYVDEDVHVLEDVAKVAERAHGVNIKLAKSGGIREAVRMAHAARALDLGVMLGCMIESSLGIAAACQIASLCDYVDLDGNLLLADDPWQGVEFREGVQSPADAPGLGVHETAARLGEGRSADPHYGKTARGVIEYGPHLVVAVVDSTQAGTTVHGIPVVASVREGLAFEPPPTTALVGVALAGGRLPTEWRDIIRECIEAGSTSSPACTSSSPTTRSSSGSRASAASSCATCAGRRTISASRPAPTSSTTRPSS